MRTRIYVPRETAAISVGADEVAIAIARYTKEHGHDIELIRNGSWGATWLEPMLEVVVGEKRIAYGNVEAADIASLFEAGLLEGGEHAKRVGPVDEIPYLINQDRWTFWRCGLINPLSVDDFQAHQGFTAISKAFEAGPQAVIDMLKTSGLRGRGGAGFPAGIKWQTVADAISEQKYIACNADEGDSGTFSDRIMMESDPLGLVEGMMIAGFAVGANKGYIYLRSEYPLTYSVLQRAIVAAREAGWLGENIQGSGFDFDIDVHLGAGSYVCGEETAMLESLEGKRGMIRFRPPLPAIKGLFARPTIVNNVISLASVPIILDKGADYYKDFGVGRSRGTLTVQLAGNVRQGGMVEIAFGKTLRELLYDFGGGSASGRPIRAVQAGGPLGAYVHPSQFDTPLDYEEFAGVGAMIGHGGLVVFDDTVDMAEQARFAMEFCAIESCGKCTPCRIGAVRGVEVIDRIRSGIESEANLALLRDLCGTMVDGSLCALGGMAPFPVISVMDHFPEDLGPSH